MTTYIAPVFVKDTNRFLIPRLWAPQDGPHGWAEAVMNELLEAASGLSQLLHCEHVEWRQFEAEADGGCDFTYYVTQLQPLDLTSPFTVFLFSGPRFTEFATREAELNGRE